MTKTTLLAIAAVATLIGIMACKVQKPANAHVGSSVEEMAQEVFQAGYEIVHNKDSSFALVLKKIKTRSNQIFTTIEFFVFDHGNGEKIHQDILPQGKIKWISEHELLCESIPGRVSSKESGKKYIYDVQTQSTKPYKK